MKKIFTAAAAIAVILIFAGQMSSCEKYVLPELTVSPDTLKFAAEADSSVTNIHSNVIWSISDIPGWITVSSDRGDRDTAVTVKVSENTTSESRQASVTVKSETILRHLTVEQAGKPIEPEQP